MSKGRFKECKNCKYYINQFYGCVDCPVMNETIEERRARRKKNKKKGGKKNGQSKSPDKY